MAQFLILLAGILQEIPTPSDSLPIKLTETEVVSTLDGTPQKIVYSVPERRLGPTLVFLHSWSGDYQQDNARWAKLAQSRGWAFLHPNFRGVNDHPEACGSRLARQDIIDALDWLLKKYPLDRNQVFLAGTSGGGHMTMLMAGYFPDRFAAASAWVGISDLTEWHRFHTREEKGRYAEMIEKSCGGPPGTSFEVDREYWERSPIHHLKRSGKLPIDIHAGIQDGKAGSVPFQHSIFAFNELAISRKGKPVSNREINELNSQGFLSIPTETDLEPDPDYGRKIHLRRHAPHGARLTIFEGGHEGLPPEAFRWFDQQIKQTTVDSKRPIN